MYIISAINEIVGEVNTQPPPPPPKEKLCSKLQRLKYFNINISREILELLNVSITEKDNTKKKELGYDVVKKSGEFIKSFLKNNKFTWIKIFIGVSTRHSGFKHLIKINVK